MIEDQREMYAALEDANEQGHVLLDGNDEGAVPGIIVDDRFVETVGLSGWRVRHLRAVAGKVEEADVFFARGPDELQFDRLQDRCASRLLVLQSDYVLRIEAIHEDEHFSKNSDVV